MSFTVDARIIGAKELEEYLFDMSNKVKDFRGPLRKAKTIMLKSIDDNFRDAGRPIQWPLLSKGTMVNRVLKIKSAGSLDTTPLQRTGNLRRSIRGEYSNNRLVMYSDVKYAALQNSGGTINRPVIKPKNAKFLSWFSVGGRKTFTPRGRVSRKLAEAIVFARKVKAMQIKIPARQFMMFQREDIEEITELIVQHVSKGKFFSGIGVS